MKLELKHLDFHNNGLVRLTRLPHWDFEKIELKNCELGFNIQEPYLRYKTVSFGLDQIKLYKRPLSDLVIDENLIEDFIGLGNWCNAYDEYLNYWYPDASYAQQAPYVIFEYFLANHYDVFDLLDNDLANNINKI